MKYKDKEIQLIATTIINRTIKKRTGKKQKGKGNCTRPVSNIEILFAQYQILLMILYCTLEFLQTTFFLRQHERGNHQRNLANCQQKQYLNKVVLSNIYITNFCPELQLNKLSILSTI